MLEHYCARWKECNAHALVLAWPRACARTHAFNARNTLLCSTKYTFVFQINRLLYGRKYSLYAWWYTCTFYKIHTYELQKVHYYVLRNIYFYGLQKTHFCYRNTILCVTKNTLLWVTKIHVYVFKKNTLLCSSKYTLLCVTENTLPMCY